MAADELTGLPSAQDFAVALDRQAALARRYDRVGAVIVVAAGHVDEPGCRAVARALRDRLRASDLVARLVEAEFAVLAHEAGPIEARELARELVAVASRAAGAPAAAGVACFPDGLDRSAGALLADADAALAAASGTLPRVVAFGSQPFRPPARGAASRADRLRRALDGGGLVVTMRPVIDLGTGRPDHHVLKAGLRSEAADLLESAERFGAGRRIDRFLVEHAAAGEPLGGTVVVPVAHGAAVDRDFADWLLTAMSERPGTAAGMILAVPETAPLADLAAVRSLAARIGEFGGRLALDGFGRVGAVALLKSLPVHHVRLDSVLVRGLPASDRDRAVVLALVHAAEALGAVPVATGVDGEAELKAVRGFGIGLAEGDCAGGVRSWPA